MMRNKKLYRYDLMFLLAIFVFVAVTTGKASSAVRLRGHAVEGDVEIEMRGRYGTLVHTVGHVRESVAVSLEPALDEGSHHRLTVLENGSYLTSGSAFELVDGKAPRSLICANDACTRAHLPSVWSYGQESLP